MTIETPRGMRDFLPSEMAKRRYVLETIRKVYALYGYAELETPALESLGILTAKSSGGEEISKQIFKMKDYGNRLLGLRFDLTVPLSRLMAQNPQVPKPFKRAQIAPVWRYEEPQAGRFREFYQADVDIIGSKEPEADLDPLAAAIAALKELGFKDFEVKVNSRKLLEELALAYGVEKERNSELFRVLDKIEKLGLSWVKKELSEKGFKNIDKFLELILTEGEPFKILEEAEKIVKNKEPVNELKEFFKLSKSFGIYSYLTLSLSLARGLDYYTGIVYEVKVSNAEEFGSVAGGGRYDNLIGLYGKETLPAVGISIGVERVLEIMEKKKMFPEKVLQYVPKVLIIPIRAEKTLEKCIEIVQKLRAVGVKADVDLMNRGLSKLLNYANVLQIPFVAILGEKEAKENKITLRDMKTGKQELINLEELIKKLK